MTKCAHYKRERRGVDLTALVKPLVLAPSVSNSQGLALSFPNKRAHRTCAPSNDVALTKGDPLP